MTIQLEILQFNYWEHFKYSKDLALIYSPETPKRRELDRVLNELITKINTLKHEQESRNTSPITETH